MPLPSRGLEITVSSPFGLTVRLNWLYTSCTSSCALMSSTFFSLRYRVVTDTWVHDGRAAVPPPSSETHAVLPCLTVSHENT